MSCVDDVGDVLAVELEEPVDNPWTTIGSKFSVLVDFDHWSTQMNIRDIRRVYPTIRLQTYPRRCELSLSKQSRPVIRFREF